MFEKRFLAKNTLAFFSFSVRQCTEEIMDLAIKYTFRGMKLSIPIFPEGFRTAVREKYEYKYRDKLFLKALCGNVELSGY